MAAVRIEEEAFSDQRIELLGQLAGYNRYEALGRLAYLWRHCTHKETSVVSFVVARAALGPKGLEALVDSELGELVNDHSVRIKGTGGRIEWLQALRKGASAGGKARAKSRSASAVAQGTAELEPEAALDCPPALTLTSAPSPSVADPEVARDKRARRQPKPKLEALDGYQPTIDLFHTRYSSAYNGAAPTWGPKQGAMLKRLLKAHGAAEVQRRIGVLFDAPPKWLTGPYDFATLVQHFDKLVGAQQSQQQQGASGRFDPSMNPSNDDNNTPPWEL